MHDAGTAPCVDRGVLSLAICKPKIRAAARPGDWIFGFGGRSRLGERLIYIAEVTESIPDGEYYRRREFSGRRDRIYRWVGHKLSQIRNLIHGPENCRKDIGRPPAYAGAAVLLSKNFRYFGCEPADQFTDRFPSLMSYVAKVGQGHRIRFPGRVEAELHAMANKIWKAYRRRKVLGRPTDRSGCDS